MLDKEYWRYNNGKTVIKSGQDVLYDNRSEVCVKNTDLETGIPIDYEELQGYVMHVEMERALRELRNFVDDNNCDSIDEVMIVRECLEKLEAKHTR